MQAAAKELDRMKLYGLRPTPERKLWLTPSQQTDGINPDVNATPGGYNSVSDEQITRCAKTKTSVTLSPFGEVRFIFRWLASISRCALARINRFLICSSNR